MNEAQKAEREKLDQETLENHNSLTKAWLDQGKPDQVRIGNSLVDFETVHNQIWKDHAAMVQARGLETGYEIEIRENAERSQIEN